MIKKFRLRSEIHSLKLLGDLLAEEGLIYDTSVLTRWQNGERIPRKRKTLITLLTIFKRWGGLKVVREANEFLESANQGYLTDYEKKILAFE